MPPHPWEATGQEVPVKGAKLRVCPSCLLSTWRSYFAGSLEAEPVKPLLLFPNSLALLIHSLLSLFFLFLSHLRVLCFSSPTTGFPVHAQNLSGKPCWAGGGTSTSSWASAWEAQWRPELSPQPRAPDPYQQHPHRQTQCWASH